MLNCKCLRSLSRHHVRRSREGRTERAREGGKAPQAAARGEEIHLEIIAMQNASTSRAYIRHAPAPRGRRRVKLALALAAHVGILSFWVAFSMSFLAASRGDIELLAPSKWDRFEGDAAPVRPLRSLPHFPVKRQKTIWRRWRRRRRCPCD